MGFFHGHGKHFAIHADIRSTKWLAAIGMWGPDVVTVSGPCPSWSEASKSAGLDSELGRLFPEAIAVCRILQPRVILFEQVGGFASHKHRQAVLDLLPWAGYTLTWARTVDLQHVCPVHRIRWLALAIRTHDQSIVKASPQPWPSSEKHTPRSFDVILPWDLALDDRLEINHSMMLKSSDHEMLPKSKRQRVSPESTFQSRCFGEHDCLPTFMAAYGSQHLIDEHLLKDKGLMMHFFVDQQKPRLFHPIEIALAHVVYKGAFIPDDWTLAWKFLGNQIAVPHSLFALVQGLNQLPSKCPDLVITQVFQVLHRERLTQSNMMLTKGVAGIVISDGSFSLDNHEHQNIVDFQQKCGQAFLPDGQFWTTRGFLTLPLPPDQDCVTLQDQKSASTEQDNSSVSQAQDSPLVSATLPFSIMLKGLLITSFGRLQFAFDSRLVGADLCNMWGGQIIEVQESLPDGISVMLASSKDVIGEPNMDLRGHLKVVPIFVDGQLLFLPSEHDNVNDFFQKVGKTVHDQFGSIHDIKLCGSNTVLMEVNHDEKSSKSWSYQNFVDAMTQCAVSVKDHPVDHFLMICFQGPRHPSMILAEFWRSLLPSHELSHVGYSMDFIQSNDTWKIRFFPLNDRCPIPVGALKLMLFVKAFRTMIQYCQTPQGLPVKIKCFGRLLWQGTILANTTIAFLIQLVEWSAHFVTDGIHFRIVHGGRRISDEQTIQDCQPSNRHLALVLHAVSAIHGGGPSSTKTQFRTQVKNALATILLQEGYTLDWVSKAIEKLIDKCGIKPLSNIIHAEGHKKLSGLMDLIKTTDIDLPSVKPTQTSSVALNSKAKRRQIVQPMPTNYTIIEGFLVNEDKSAVKQLQEFGSKTSGAYLTSPQEAIPWLRAGEKLTPDELGLLIIGGLPFPTALKTQAVTVPCKDEKSRDVLLACTLVQFGDKQIALNPQDKHQVAKTNTTMMAITLWKEDWINEWPQIVTNPVAFVKSVGRAEDQILSVWGRSFRNGKMPTTSSDATSIQMHCLIKEDSVNSFLSKSGFNGLWATPKTEEGRPSNNFRLLWLPDTMDRQEANVLAAKLHGALGLVKGKNRLALRILNAHFDDAWKQLRPHEAIPEAIVTSKVFKIESLPFGTTMEMLKEWAGHQPWRIRPFRAVGPRAWVVGSSDMPPTHQLFFNSMPVLIRELPPRFAQTSNPIVAGPRPTLRNQTGNQHHNSGELRLANGLGGADPWANWTGPRPNIPQTAAPPARATTGPIDNKFNKQDERLDRLESELKKIQEDQKCQAGNIQNIEKQATVRDKENQKQLDQKLGNMKAEFEKSFTMALTNQSQQFDARKSSNFSLDPTNVKDRQMRMLKCLPLDNIGKCNFVA